jgi:hypothetical protein
MSHDEDYLDYLEKNVPIATVGSPDLLIHLFVLAILSFLGIGFMLKMFVLYFVLYLIWSKTFAKAEESMIMVLISNFNIPRGIVGKMSRAMPADTERKTDTHEINQ